MQRILYQKFSRFIKPPQAQQKWAKQHKNRKFTEKVRWRLFVLIAVLVANLSLNFGIPVARAAECADVEFIFARGSGEEVVSKLNPNGSPSFQKWKSALENAMSDSGLEYEFYDLGFQSNGGHRYPATPVTGSFNGVANLIGAAISAGESFAFSRSVAEGVAELEAHIKLVSAVCRDTKFVLGGFSQGAMVISKTLGSLDPDKIIYAATFGDPKIYLPEGDSHNGLLPKVPDACRGLNLSNYRVYVPDCYAYKGALGGYQPYQPEGYLDKLGTWCNGKDIMCSSGWSISDHTAYVDSDLYEQAASLIRERIDVAFAITGIAPPTSESPSNHDVVFLFDSTGSMSSMLNAYKTQAKELVRTILQAGGRVALYAYQEYVEDYWPSLRCDFSCNEDELGEAINDIRAWGGGDKDEGLLSAIRAAFNELHWSHGATKSVVVLTDAGYHDPDRDGSTLENIVEQSLEIDPVNIYVISRDQEETYAELVRLTNGAYYDVRSEIELSTKQITERPVARLDQELYYGVVGDTLMFDASTSHSQYEDDLTFDWDLDGDGIFELTRQSSQVSKKYTSEFEDFIQVKVTDSHGTNTMSAKVKISPQPETPTQITDLRITGLSDNAQSVTFKTDGVKVLVALEDLPVGFITPESGIANFSINEVTQNIRLTLIPYSATGRRGAETIVTLQASLSNSSQANRPDLLAPGTGTCI